MLRGSFLDFEGENPISNEYSVDDPIRDDKLVMLLSPATMEKLWLIHKDTV